MRKRIFLNFVITLFIAFNSTADASIKKFEGVKFDHTQTIDGVTIHSTKVDDTRIFYSTQRHVFDLDIDKVYKYLTRFDLRCNNEFKKRRKLTPKNKDCPYHNQNMVEAVIVRDLKSQLRSENVIDQYVVKRRIYNRGKFSYNDLVTVKKLPRDDKKESYEISYEMIPEGKAKNYIDDPVEFNSAFNFTKGKYTITQIEKGKTQIDYVYFTKTDHWFLNTDMIRSKVYESISKGTKNSIEQLVKYTKK